MEPKEFLESIRNGLDEAYVEDNKDKIKELEGMYHGARTMYEIFEERRKNDKNNNWNKSV